MIGNGKNGKQQHTTSNPMMDFKLDMGDATVELAWKTAQVPSPSFRTSSVDMLRLLV